MSPSFYVSVTEPSGKCQERMKEADQGIKHPTKKLPKTEDPHGLLKEPCGFKVKTRAKPVIYNRVKESRCVVSSYEGE